MDNIDDTINPGYIVVRLILWAAGLLRESYAPGYIVLLLVITAGVFVFWLTSRDRGRLEALKWATMNIERSSNRLEFRADLVRLNQEFNKARNNKSKSTRATAKHALGVAWGEYFETMVVPNDSSDEAARNGLRPAVFFNINDLNFEPGLWRILPGLFVSGGLFLTFLGLIAALDAVGGGGGKIDDIALTNLLSIASAKFFMSLTGLACSIVLTILGRISSHKVETKVRALCHAIEKKLLFQSLEEIGKEQLEAIKSSNDAMRHLATELVEKISAPLRNEIPHAISGAIRGELEPLLGAIGQQSEEGIGQMVGDLSKRFSDDVGQALTLASDRLGAAADRFEGLTSKMEGGAGRMGREYEDLAERLQKQMSAAQEAMQSQMASTQANLGATVKNLLDQMSKTLEAVQANTHAGADAIAQASADMKAAATDFRQQMEGATETGSRQIQENMSMAAINAGNSIATATSQLTDPLNELSKQIEVAANATRLSSAGLHGVAEAAQKGGAAILEGSQRFINASEAFSKSATPIRDSVISLRNTATQMSEGIDKALESNLNQVRTIADRSSEALNSAVTVLRHEQQAIDSSMQALAVALNQLRGQGDRLDDVDQKIGRALEQYRIQVDATISTTQEKVIRMTEGLTRALDTLREIVSQTEEFIPQSAINRTNRP